MLNAGTAIVGKADLKPHEELAMKNGDLLSVTELRAMCRRIKMTHETEGEKQTLSLDVSRVEEASLLYNHLLASVPSGGGMLELPSVGSIFARYEGARIVAILATGPPEAWKTDSYLGQKMTIPRTKPGWLLSMFKAKSCSFA